MISKRDTRKVTYQTLPVCACNCECGKAAGLMREQGRVHQFLMGLDHRNFNTSRSNIISQESLPSLNKVYAMIVREERQLQFTESVEARPSMEGVAFKATPQNRKGQNQPRCSHCPKSGHEHQQCFELILLLEIK